MKLIEIVHISGTVWNPLSGNPVSRVRQKPECKMIIKNWFYFKNVNSKDVSYAKHGIQQTYIHSSMGVTICTHLQQFLYDANEPEIEDSQIFEEEIITDLLD